LFKRIAEEIPHVHLFPLAFFCRCIFLYRTHGGLEQIHSAPQRNTNVEAASSQSLAQDPVESAVRSEPAQTVIGEKLAFGQQSVLSFFQQQADCLKPTVTKMYCLQSMSLQFLVLMLHCNFTF